MLIKNEGKRTKKRDEKKMGKEIFTYTNVERLFFNKMIHCNEASSESELWWVEVQE